MIKASLKDNYVLSNRSVKHAKAYVCVFGPAFKARTRINFLHSKVRTFWQSEVKISVLALWLCALSSLCHNMGVGGGGMDVILSLYVPGMFRGVWKNVLTLNVLYTDLSSLWMPGRTHYTHVCILCPHFECRARYVCVCVCVWGGWVWMWVGVCVCEVNVGNFYRSDVF